MKEQCVDVWDLPQQAYKHIQLCTGMKNKQTYGLEFIYPQ